MGQVMWGGVAAVGGMFAVFLLVGWLAARKVKAGTASELLVAGRAMPLWVAVMTMTATWVDGGYLMGTAQMAYADGLAAGFQPGLCFGLSLILGGLFFARRMRRLEFTTLIDPFEVRFGKRWAAVLFLPALFAEVIWSAELLVAIGATTHVMLGMRLTTAIVLSAAVVTAYTVVGGMWSVAYTDVVQLGMIPAGLLAALPFALAAAGGLDDAWQTYLGHNKAKAAYLIPPLVPHDGSWTAQQIIPWWGTAAMLVLGGIPWNCYFQRVLSCRTPEAAQWHSILSGVLTIVLTVPPLMLGVAAVSVAWGSGDTEQLAEQPDLVLPLLLTRTAPALVAVVGLGAIVGAVTSSFSASILSAGSMFSWNVWRRLLQPRVSADRMKFVVRGSILLLGAAAVALALTVRNVYALWVFTSDLVFVLLFPQLVMALFDPWANRVGSVVAFTVSLVLRLGGGETLFALPAFIPYHEIFAGLLPGDPSNWYDAAKCDMLFPFRVLAAAAGLILLPVVSRLTARWDPPQPLGKLTPKTADLQPE